ncbi:DUF418 domain-containing protein [Sutcliffiella rhizosphaerae]|uniref:DUF418 domain-containing protein n=1 Tax=Sutcliffiella rhizosphaerae TaxID=2880967 RepID=A0ABM8YU13_9BACI|nr:DUF418 domain-containing protein [Sutcliffiella rhizosphaerae]CAG9623464.1 hypothetical protein BACCIP111883_04277 [Sutcliffiella rhizosphaerae]
MQAAPIQERERIVALDIVRGFAILGIFLVNMPSFFAPILYINQNSYWTDTKDIFVVNAIDIMAQASFYTLFSFLFGYGFIIFTKRVAEKNLSVPKYFSKRLIVLLIIGILHAFFIWHGDILITYAICGFVLLLVRNLSPKVMMWIGLSLVFVPTILLSSLLMLTMLALGGIDPYVQLEGLVEQSLNIYANGSFWEITSQRIFDWSYVNVSGFIFIALAVLPMFFFGAAAAKSGWLTNVEDKLGIFRKLWLITFMLAVMFKLLPYYTEKNYLTEYLQDGIGGPASAIFYFLTVVLATRTDIGKKILSPLQYVGKLSLSNYLLQSVVFSTVFYSYGLGLYGSFTPFYGLLLVIGFYIFQVVVSKFWVNKFYYGPMEWLWRAGTYGIRPKFKKDVS